MAGAGFVPTADVIGLQHWTTSNQRARGDQVCEVTWSLPVTLVITQKAVNIGYTGLKGRISITKLLKNL